MTQKPLISPAVAKKFMTPQFGSRFRKVMVKYTGTPEVSGEIDLFEHTSGFLSQLRVLYHKKYVFIFDRPPHRSPWFTLNLSGCDNLCKATVPESTETSDLKHMKRFRYLTRRLTTSASRQRILFKCGEATLMGQSPLANEIINPLISNAYSWEKREILYKSENVEPDARVMKDMHLVFSNSFSIHTTPMTPVQQQPSGSPVCPESKPSKEQMDHVFNTLRKTLPKLFIQALDYTIYHPNIIFENNLQGIRTRGLLPYVCQVAALRILGHLKFAFVKLDLLKITLHENEKTIKVRWRIRGVTTFKVLLHFWKYKFWSIDDSIAEFQETWYDGFSTYYIGEEGTVIKHILDKIVPEEDECLAQVPAQSALATNN